MHYFVSPMLFSLKLKLFCEGDENGCVDQAFGDSNQNINVENGEIINFNTLFPSTPSEHDNKIDIKGIMILL